MAGWTGNPSFDVFGLPEEHQELRAAIRLLLETAHTLAEGAGAAPLAAALRLCDTLAGRRVALMLSGGNLSLNQLREVIAECGLRIAD